MMKEDVFNNAENITVAENDAAAPEVNAVKANEHTPAICTGTKPEHSANPEGYYILQDGRKELYCATYLGQLINTGKMAVSNLRYDREEQKLVFA